ncbi:MAG: SDR family oxidoreductase [Bacteroidetes bacterium]|nr:SDR family oxidoreductase [Bacteroidota bacterium]
MIENKNIFSLDGKTVIVTGAAGLIGKALCGVLSDFGADVAVCDIDFTKAERIASRLNGNSFAVGLDVTDSESVRSACRSIMSKTGRIDVLINSAAVNDKFTSGKSILEQSKFENFPEDLWNDSLRVNLTGTFLCCKIFGAKMTGKKGSIINISSTYGLVGPDQSIYTDENGRQMFYKSPAYPAGKGAVINFTRYLAAYWGRKGVRVNVLCPGGVEDSQDRNFKKNYSQKTMLGRMAKPYDYTGPAVFLSSDASSYMTGAVLVVDGGWTAW